MPASTALPDLWRLLLAGVQADCLSAALELRLFEHLRQPCEPAALAKRLEWPQAPCEALLDVLGELGLLERNGPAWRASGLALAHFCAEAPGYCGGAWLFRQQALRGVGERLRGGPQVFGALPDAAQRAAWGRAAAGQLAQEQRAFSQTQAVDLLRRLGGLADGSHWLDLGGGPGAIAMAIAQAWPETHGTLFDFPEAQSVAADNVRDAGLSARLQTLGGDLESDSPGTGYDLIWCSSVLHFLSDPAATLARLHAALRPGGRLLCLHAEWSTGDSLAARVLPYYLPLRLQQRWVPRPGEMARLLTAAGFARVEALGALDMPLAPVQVYLAQRAP
ncbi:MAG: N,N-dimethyltransferase OxyT [Pseudomonas citronellolis]|nr:MAG: N,N-dimethyltransferase OxyT [Pseudomonas citronellolis]